MNMRVYTTFDELQSKEEYFVTWPPEARPKEAVYELSIALVDCRFSSTIIFVKNPFYFEQKSVPVQQKAITTTEEIDEEDDEVEDDGAAVCGIIMKDPKFAQAVMNELIQAHKDRGDMIIIEGDHAETDLVDYWIADLDSINHQYYHLIYTDDTLQSTVIDMLKSVTDDGSSTTVVSLKPKPNS